jgi:hypothetical protein
VNVGGTQILPAPVMQLDSTFSRTPAKFGASVPDLRRSRRGLWVALGLMVPATAVLLWVSVGRHWLQDPEPNEPVIPFPRSAAEKPAEPERRVSPPAVRRFELRVEPSNAEIRLDDLAPVRGRLDRSIADDHAPHTIRISAAGHESQVIALDPDDLPPKVIRLNPLTSPPPARTANTDKKGTHRHKRAEGGSAVSRPIRERTSETQSRGTNDAPILP